MAEAEKHDDQLQAANISANLGLVARAGGDLDGALLTLEEAHRMLAAISAPHLDIQIHLWLAELYLERGERAAAEEALAWAESGLDGSERYGLQMWAKRVRAELGWELHCLRRGGGRWYETPSLSHSIMFCP